MRRQRADLQRCRRPRANVPGRRRPGPGSRRGPARRSRRRGAPGGRAAAAPGSQRAAATSTGTSTRIDRSAARPPVAQRDQLAPARPGRDPARSPGTRWSTPAKRSVTTQSPAASAGSITWATCSARSAAIKQGLGPRPTGRARRGRGAGARSAAPDRRRPGLEGQRGRRAPRPARAAWVDLPQPSMPSSAMQATPGRHSERFGRCGVIARVAVSRRGVLGRRLRGRLLRGRPSSPRLLGRGLLGGGLLLGRRGLLRRRLLLAASRGRRPGARPAARTPARWSIDSTSSPLRSEALVVPSVT